MAADAFLAEHKGHRRGGNTMSKLKGDESAFGVAAGSAGFCMRCSHWEPRDAMQEPGYVPSAAIGYCPIFDKLTEARHGIHCTAFSPNAQGLTDAENRTKKPAR